MNRRIFLTGSLAAVAAGAIAAPAMTFGPFPSPISELPIMPMSQLVMFDAADNIVAKFPIILAEISQTEDGGARAIVMVNSDRTFKASRIDVVRDEHCLFRFQKELTMLAGDRLELEMVLQ